MVKYYSTPASTPTYSITVNGNKVKVYPNNKVYLKGGTQFEMSFENLTQDSYKAEISFNGIPQKSALVLKPGMRYNLERFMDVDRKLMTDVYTVDDSPEVKAAISNNGWITVHFFKEREYVKPHWFGSTTRDITFDSFGAMDLNKYSTGETNVNGSVNYSSGPIKIRKMVEDSGDEYSASSIGRSMSKSIKRELTLSRDEIIDVPSSLETARIEKGDKSKQEFTYVNMEFEQTPSSTLIYQILPESFMPVNVVKPSDIRSYCPKCGRKIKKGWNGCPNCLIEV